MTMHTGNIDLEAARTALVDILYQRAFLLSVPLAPARERRHASDHRKAERVKQFAWISPADALYVAGTDNPHDLNTTLMSGQVRCRFQHVGRWWIWKEVPAPIWKAIKNGVRMIGAGGTSLVDSEQWKLRVSEEDWRNHLGQPVADAPTSSSAEPVLSAVTDAQALPRNANTTKIEAALQTEYEDAKTADRKTPNLKEAARAAQARLRAEGYFASQEKIMNVDAAFSRRRPRGRTLKSEKVTT